MKRNPMNYGTYVAEQTGIAMTGIAPAAQPTPKRRPVAVTGIAPQTEITPQTQVVEPTQESSTMRQHSEDFSAMDTASLALNGARSVNEARAKWEAMIATPTGVSAARNATTVPVQQRVVVEDAMPTHTGVSVLSRTQVDEAKAVHGQLSVASMLAMGTDERYLTPAQVADKNAVATAVRVLRVCLEGVVDVEVLGANTYGYAVLGINVLVHTEEAVLGLQVTGAVVPTAIAFLRYMDGLLVGYARTKKAVRTGGQKAKYAFEQLLGLDEVQLTLAEENALLVLGVAVRRGGVLELTSRS